MAERVITTEGSTPPSEYFRYEGGKLVAERASLERIASEHGTPSYVYSAAAIDNAYKSVDTALAGVPHTIHYAVKANSNLAVLRRLSQLGSGADIVSGGELARALRAGFTADRIVFSGVGKTDPEIRAALEADVRAIHVESTQELDAVEGIAKSLGRVARIALRVNPNVDAGTHPYIATGLRSSKFGISLEHAASIIPRIVSSTSVRLDTLACHVGSMVQSPNPIADAVAIVADFAREQKKKGAPIATIDAGGGWPITYGDESVRASSNLEFGAAIISALKRGGDDFKLAVEPGRYIVGDSGILLTRVVFVKEQYGKRFIVVDAAMTELIRPALYGAFHAIVPIDAPAPDAALSSADVVGPVCESGDFLAKDRMLPELKRGDLLAVRGAGAYAAVMASTYNARPLAAELMIEGERVSVVRRRQAIESQWQDEPLPE